MLDIPQPRSQSWEYLNIGSWIIPSGFPIKDYESEGKWRKVKVYSVASDSLWPHGLYSPWNSPGQNTGVGSLSLLQGIFPTQGSNPGLPHCRQILYHTGVGSLSLLQQIFPTQELNWSLQQCLQILYQLSYEGNWVDSLEKTLMLEKIEGRRRREQQRMRWLDGVTNLIDMSLSKLQQILKDREAWSATVHWVEKTWTWLND